MDKGYVNLHVKINNLPHFDISEYAYIVVRYVEGQLWFYGAYSDIETAESAADSLYNGLLLENRIY